ncbi:hypothetical protein EDD11_004949 [Mortierella claussenii]|nr:hypothetical protein EDD11_004949 [Mortierella claussenii]
MAAPTYSPIPFNPTPTHPSAGSSAESGAGSFPLPPPNQSPFSAVGLGYIRKFREERLSSLRPFSEFLDTSRMSKPDGIASMYHMQQTMDFVKAWTDQAHITPIAVTSRLSYNLPYFQGNYTAVFLGITAYSLVNNAMLMFSVGFTVGGMHFISKVPPEGLIFGTTRYNPRQLQTGLFCVAVPMFFFSSTVGTVFYIIGK